MIEEKWEVTVPDIAAYASTLEYRESALGLVSQAQFIRKRIHQYKTGADLTTDAQATAEERTTLHDYMKEVYKVVLPRNMTARCQLLYSVEAMNNTQNRRTRNYVLQQAAEEEMLSAPLVPLTDPYVLAKSFTYNDPLSSMNTTGPILG